MPSIWFSSPQLFYWQIIIIVNQLWRVVSVCLLLAWSCKRGHVGANKTIYGTGTKPL